MTTESRTPLWMKVFLALFILGLTAGGVGGIKTFLETRQETAKLNESGVEVEANVMSATEFRRPRGVRYTEIRVSYDVVGPELLGFGEVQDCDGARFEPGTQTVDVVYLPEDPEIIRLAECRSSFDSEWFPGIIGIIFFAFALFMLWRLRRFWTS